MNKTIKFFTSMIMISFFQVGYCQQKDTSKKNTETVFDFGAYYPCKIKFNDDSIWFANKNDLVSLNTVQQLDDQLRSNIQKIDTDSVLLDTSSKTNADRVRAVLKVLSKYGITRPHKVIVFQ